MNVSRHHAAKFGDDSILRAVTQPLMRSGKKSGTTHHHHHLHQHMWWRHHHQHQSTVNSFHFQKSLPQRHSVGAAVSRGPPFPPLRVLPFTATSAHTNTPVTQNHIRNASQRQWVQHVPLTSRLDDSDSQAGYVIGSLPLTLSPSSMSLRLPVMGGQ